jgi:hypothetical protein
VSVVFDFGDLDQAEVKIKDQGHSEVIFLAPLSQTGLARIQQLLWQTTLDLPRARHRRGAR